MSNPNSTTNTTQANAYLKTRVFTASPEELRLMLLDGAIKFANQGIDGLNRRDYEASFNGISQCRNIIFELMTTIRPDVDPELAGKVRSLYSFLYTQTIEASHEKSSDKLKKVVDLLEYERETWVMLMQKLAEERAAARPASAGVVAQPAATGGDARPSFSVSA